MARKSAQDAIDDIERLKATRGTEALLQLVRYSTHPRGAVRSEAVNALWDHWAFRLSDPKVSLVAVRAAVSDSDTRVRDTAIEALGEMGNRTDVKRLLWAAQDEEWTVRCTAAASLASVGGKAAIRKVCRMMAEEPEPCVRMWAAGGIGVNGRVECVDQLLEVVGLENDDQARTGILESLLRLGRWEFLGAFLGLFDSDNRHAPHLALKGVAEMLEEELVPKECFAEIRLTLEKLDPKPFGVDGREWLAGALACLR
jgi:HEAT repeat protein